MVVVMVVVVMVVVAAVGGVVQYIGGGIGDIVDAAVGIGVGIGVDMVVVDGIGVVVVDNTDTGMNVASCDSRQVHTEDLSNPHLDPPPARKSQTMNRTKLPL